MPSIPIALSIAGSDPSGGAGIQADLKTFSALGAYGAAVLAALTAQNTRGVTGIHNVPPEFVALQIDTVFADLRVDAVKIGMISTAATARAVAASLRRAEARNVVLDPVMIAKSGHALLDPSAVGALREELVPLATVITPNLPEARVLAAAGGVDVPDEPEALARALHALGPRAVVVTGGHRDEATDVFFDGGEPVDIPGERHADGAAHGSGCTHSSALADHLALGRPPLEAARWAKLVASEAVRDGLRAVGHGAGPVDALGVLARSRAPA